MSKKSTSDGTFSFYEDDEDKYTRIYNDSIVNKELTDTGFRLLCYLLSNRSDFVIYESVTRKRLGWGEKKLNNAKANLVKTGHAKIQQVRKNGKFCPNDYQIARRPVFKEENTKLLELKKADKEIKKSFTHRRESGTVKSGTSEEGTNNINITTTNPNKTKDIVNNKQTLPIKRRITDSVIDLPTRFKLTEQQRENYLWLKSENIPNTSDETLIFWAKTYSFKRLFDVFKYAKENSKETLGGYMNYILSQEAVIANDICEENRQLAEDYKKSTNWHCLEIFEKHIKCPIGDGEKDIPLTLESKIFFEQLLNLHDLYQTYRA